VGKSFYQNKKTFGGIPKVAFTKNLEMEAHSQKILKKRFKKIAAIGGDGTIIELENGFFKVEEKQVNHVNIGNQNNKATTTHILPIGSVNSEAIMSGGN
jgi:diacylglycerol kinase family enzyme